MNFNHLEYITEIAKYGSISKTAHHLLLSQPYLSGMIRSLEAELGYTFFARTPTGVILTPEGEQFINSSRRILLELKKIREIRPQIENQDLNISCYYSPYIMKRFLNYQNQSLAPTVDQLKEMGIQNVLNSVVAGDSRIGIIFYAKEREDNYRKQAADLRLCMKNLLSPWKIYAICSPCHPLANQKSITVHELCNNSFVCYDDSCSRNYLQLLGLTQQSQILNVSDRGSLYDALKSGKHLSIAAYRTFPTQSEFIVLPFSDEEHYLLSSYLIPVNYKLNRREAAFLKYLQSSEDTDILL